MSDFTMVIGLPGSGKSTLCNKLCSLEKDKNVYLSSDELREKLLGDINNQSENHTVFEVMNKMAIESLKANKNVYYDATNISSKRRRALLQTIKKYTNNCICLVLATPLEICLERNKNRNRVVPESVISNMYLNFEFPGYFEGWDLIEIIRKDNFTKNLFSSVINLMNYNQDNPYHLETLGEHLVGTFDYLIKRTNNIELQIAGLFHDIGKPYVKQFKDCKGNKTDIAHYYRHENVSAYETMFLPKEYNLDIVKVCEYVQYHMKPFSWNEEKTVQKYKNIYGEQFYNNIMLLNEADKASCKV